MKQTEPFAPRRFSHRDAETPREKTAGLGTWGGGGGGQAQAPHAESLATCRRRGVLLRFPTQKKVILASRLVLENNPQNRLQLRSVKKNSSTSESQSRLIRGKRIRWPCNWCTGSSTAKTPAQIPYIRFRALMLRYSLIIRSVKSFGDVSISITPDSRSMAA